MQRFPGANDNLIIYRTASERLKTIERTVFLSVFVLFFRLYILRKSGGKKKEKEIRRTGFRL